MAAKAQDGVRDPLTIYLPEDRGLSAVADLFRAVPWKTDADAEQLAEQAKPQVEGMGPHPVPEWIQIVAAGEKVPEGWMIHTRDGRRSMLLRDPTAIVDALNAAQESTRIKPIDVNHSEFRWNAPTERPAYGHTVEYRAEADGSIWGKAEWTDLGLRAVSHRHYRFTSGVLGLTYQANSEGDIDFEAPLVVVDVYNVSLVNRPAAYVVSVNSADFNDGAMVPEEAEDEVKITDEQLAALGLKPGATFEQLAAAIGKGAAAPEARSEYVELARKANEAERQVVTLTAKVGEAQTALKHVQAQLSAQEKRLIERELAAANRDGRLEPGQNHLYERIAKVDGFEKFMEELDKLPKSKLTSTEQADVKDSGTSQALSIRERKMIRRVGLSEEQYKKGRETLSERKRKALEDAELGAS